LSSLLYKPPFLVKFTVVPSIPLVIISILSANPNTWIATNVHHFYFEIIAVIMSSIVSFYCVTRAYALNDAFSLFIGVGFIISAIIDLFHAIVSFNFMNQEVFLKYFIPQTWFAGRLFSSAMLVVAIAKYDKFGESEGGKNNDSSTSKSLQSLPAGSLMSIGSRSSVFIIAILFLSIAALSSFLTIFPSIMISYPATAIIHRPYEFPSLVLFSIALIYFYKKQIYKINDVFCVGLGSSLIIWIFTQIIMSFSTTPFDTAFNVAHILKNAGYFVIIISLALSSIQYHLKLKENQKLISLQYEKLKELDKLKDDFIKMAAHELRTPLQPIISYNALASQGLIDKDEAMRVIDLQARRLHKLTDNIFTVSKIESGTLQYKKQKIMINDIISESLESTKRDPELGKEVSIVEKLEKTCNVEILADPSMTNQAISNIISNAVKFTKVGTIEVETFVYYDKNKVQISVRDTGTGIPKEVLADLFGKFVSKGVETRNKHGTGLGLFISNAIVKAHQGKIIGYNNNVNGKGATFIITLPIDPGIHTNDNNTLEN
jgi:signal transduction histidine kinase